jgi:anti-sigma regulatory factor (Ser/Thr protein kinase)
MRRFRRERGEPEHGARGSGRLETASSTARPVAPRGEVNGRAPEVFLDAHQHAGGGMRSASGPAPGHDDRSPVATLTLPASTESVPAARRFVTEALTDLGAAGACDDAVALVCELATNAVIHARTSYTIAVSRDGDAVRVGVHDLSAVMPRRRSYGLDATTGRGLRLVASMSSDWGIEAESAGKVVWFEMPCEGGDRTPPEWYADVDVEALLSAFGEGELGGLSRVGSVVTE